MKSQGKIVGSVVVIGGLSLLGPVKGGIALGVQSPKLVDCPTPGGPLPGWADVELRFAGGGGVLGDITLGLFSRLWMGIAYGGEGIIGYQKPRWNPLPGVHMNFRLLNESSLLPALAFGFTNQGYGRWLEEVERYQYRARGFYLTLAKSFATPLGGEWAWYIGASRNTTEEPRKGVDLFAALSLKPIPLLEMVGEFSGGLNERNDPHSISLNKGYLNAAIRLYPGSRFAIDLILHDITSNLTSEVRGGESIGRELRVSYQEPLFKR